MKMKANKKMLVVAFVLLFMPFVALAADSTAGNTYIFDSVGVKTSESLSIVWMWWTGVTTDGHQIAVYEFPSGNLIWKAAAKAGWDLGVPFFGTSGKIQGIEVRTLGSGELQVRRGLDQ